MVMDSAEGGLIALFITDGGWQKLIERKYDMHH
jgi:hypothetical protein